MQILWNLQTQQTHIHEHTHTQAHVRIVCVWMRSSPLSPAWAFDPQRRTNASSLRGNAAQNTLYTPEHTSHQTLFSHHQPLYDIIIISGQSPAGQRACSVSSAADSCPPSLRRAHARSAPESRPPSSSERRRRSWCASETAPAPCPWWSICVTIATQTEGRSLWWVNSPDGGEQSVLQDVSSIQKQKNTANHDLQDKTHIHVITACTVRHSVEETISHQPLCLVPSVCNDPASICSSSWGTSGCPESLWNLLLRSQTWHTRYNIIYGIIRERFLLQEFTAASSGGEELIQQNYIKGYSLNWWIWACTCSSQTWRNCLYNMGETLYEQRFSTACVCVSKRERES